MTNKKDLEEILIVEDSPTQAERLRYVLEQHGYRVSLARNGREAMDLLANHRPSLVISDILMPEADGYEVCRFVRQRPGPAKRAGDPAHRPVRSGGRDAGPGVRRR